MCCDRFLYFLACPVINITCLCVICDSCWVNCSWTDTTSQSWHGTSVNQRTWSSWWTSWETRAPTFSLRLSMSSRYTLFFQINWCIKNVTLSKLCFIWRMHYVPKPSKGHMIALCKEQFEMWTWTTKPVLIVFFFVLLRFTSESWINKLSIDLCGLLWSDNIWPRYNYFESEGAKKI